MKTMNEHIQGVPDAYIIRFKTMRAAAKYSTAQRLAAKENMQSD